MKELSEVNLPEDIRYTKDHEWARKKGETFQIGITDFAQDQLGDIVFVELPEPGDRFESGEEFGTVESVKAVSELFMPMGGEVAAINEALEDAPELVNTAPHTEGWMLELKASDSSEYDQLMDRAAYLDMLKGLEE
ncbi:MAG: glycine cleavage system protein GcvH [Desulfobacteraceae bacterium]|nr:glycine cleavage system protein GcvH [Desulfobacteraceae bacterium]MBC2749827.1 glycine cleavage system protein GcvH [Desulfobacteraceae bacterium]